MLELKERDPFSNLFLEVIDDPLKKELLFYLMCYSQVVRREGTLYVELDRFLSCAYRSFKNNRSHWKDVLVELNLFTISDLYGNVFTGKDIYRLKEDEVYFISIKQEYAELFEGINTKAFKLWNILSRSMVYRKPTTVQDAVILSAMLFNESLYEETLNYCELCEERYRSEASYFKALRHLSLLYVGKEAKALEALKRILILLEGIGNVYYGINLDKLRRDVESLIRRLEKGKALSPISIEFVRNRKGKKGFLHKLLNVVKDFVRKLFRGKRGSPFKEVPVCSKSSPTLYTSL
mgnify:CR=1 FL=1